MSDASTDPAVIAAQYRAKVAELTAKRETIRAERVRDSAQRLANAATARQVLGAVADAAGLTVRDAPSGPALVAGNYSLPVYVSGTTEPLGTTYDGYSVTIRDAAHLAELAVAFAARIADADAADADA